MRSSRSSWSKGRLQGKILVASLKGLTDREVARTYADFEICVPRSELPALDDGEYYWYQLQGLMVLNQAGAVARSGRSPARDRSQ